MFGSSSSGVHRPGARSHVDGAAGSDAGGARSEGRLSGRRGRSLAEGESVVKASAKPDWRVPRTGCGPTPRHYLATGLGPTSGGITAFVAAN